MTIQDKKYFVANTTYKVTWENEENVHRRFVGIFKMWRDNGDGVFIDTKTGFNRFIAGERIRRAVPVKR